MYHRSIRRAGVIFLMCFVLLGLLVPATVSAAPAQPEKQAAAAQEGYGGFYYTVRPGDNLTRIANRYGTTVGAIMSANGLYSSVIFVGQVLYHPSRPGWRRWRWRLVRPDLYRAAGRHPIRHCPLVRRQHTAVGGCQQYLQSQPHLCRPAAVHPSGGGHSPYPPPAPPPPPGPSCGQYYTVRPGDTLSEIARCCGTTVQSIVNLNGIWNPSRIYVGQVLRLW